MKFSNCPKCGEGQQLKDILTLTNHNSKVCHSCGVEYVLERSVSTKIFLGLILPFIPIHYFQPFDGMYNLVALFVWALMVFLYYVFRTPLEIKNT